MANLLYRVKLAIAYVRFIAWGLVVAVVALVLLFVMFIVGLLSDRDDAECVWDACESAFEYVRDKLYDANDAIQELT